LQLDFATLQPKERYKLLIGLVVPRPIALVTTLSPEGVVNAAPFSFFNVFAEDPALVVIGVERRDAGLRKDTAANVAEAGEFVVNLVDEATVEAMNRCAADFPPEASELDFAGYTAAPSLLLRTPRLAESPAALECRHWRTIEVRNGRELIIGEVVAAHARDGLVDRDRLHVDHQAYRPVGRLAGNDYCRTRDTFGLPKVAPPRPPEGEP
jgi:flavin reductase (DIM6/NTAB) family NADH-FMN oxidoreductase RutF